MQTIDEFMQEFFQAHADVERIRVSAYQRFRDRFLADGYHAFSPHEITQAPEAERIASVTREGSTAVVTTSTATGETRPIYRYHLLARGDKWVVTQVEMFCVQCRGNGRSGDGRACSRCNGRGWEAMAETQT